MPSLDPGPSHGGSTTWEGEGACRSGEEKEEHALDLASSVVASLDPRGVKEELSLLPLQKYGARPLRPCPTPPGESGRKVGGRESVEGGPEGERMDGGRERRHLRESAREGERQHI